MATKELKIAVIGGGVAGTVASYLLQRRHDVTLYEKNEYLGGHTHTIVIDHGLDTGTPVDTGFIVYNDRTYPLFTTFLSQLNIAVRKTEMSFSYTNRQTGLQYASRNMDSLFAQRQNVFRPAHWKLLADIIRFNRTTLRLLRTGKLQGLSLGEYVAREGFKENLIENYLVPMAAAIWSTPDLKMMEFPAESFFRFFENHGLLSVTDQPQWYYVHGGSHSYIQAFLNIFRGTVRLNHSVAMVRREHAGVSIFLSNRAEKTFDRVVIATHADEAFSMLSDPSDEETRLLSPWRYAQNHTVLHTDISLLPPNRRAWASWNYQTAKGIGAESPVTVTYDMNRLQKLTAQNHYCVTLNPPNPIPDEHIIREIDYHHPMYTFETMATQEDLASLNGQRNTYFCGSYFGYGFHEDAVRSAVRVAEQFGITL